MRTIEYPYRIIGTSTLVQDVDGDCLLLSLYNYIRTDEDPVSVLPNGTFLALVAPYMKNSEDNRARNLMLRCDNPQCVLEFDSKEDWESAIDFYENKLGLKTKFKNSAIGWAQMEVGKGVFLGIERVMKSDNEFKELVGRFVAASLQVDDIDQTYNTLKQKGVEFISPPEKQGWGGTLAHFKDIDGNVLTLMSMN